jgi:PAS domain S-box-containing protein
MTIFETIFASWSLPIVVFDRDLNITYCNAAYEAVTQHELSEMSGKYVFDVFPDDEERVEFVKQKFFEALAGKNTSLDEVQFSLTGKDGKTTQRVWQATQEPFFNDAGEVTHIIQRADDVTLRVKARKESELIKEELNHRMKNIHTVIGAMARLSSKSSESIDEFRDSFLGRLNSMSRSHERLLRAGLSQVTIRAIFEDEISNVINDADGCVVLNGPSLKLQAPVARSITLLAHELATNAAKHGCFSKEQGSLNISWAVQGDQVHITWTEKGMENLVAPERTGFGSKMIDMLPGIQFERDFRPTGLQAKASLPLFNA